MTLTILSLLPGTCSNAYVHISPISLKSRSFLFAFFSVSVVFYNVYATSVPFSLI